jgi:hypothetical protein
LQIGNYFSIKAALLFANQSSFFSAVLQVQLSSISSWDTSSRSAPCTLKIKDFNNSFFMLWQVSENYEEQKLLQGCVEILTKKNLFFCRFSSSDMGKL